MTVMENPPDIVESMASAVAFMLEAECEKEGWDRPARLYDIVGVDMTDDANTRLTDLIGPVSEDGMVMAFGLRNAQIITGHPVDAVTGRVCGDDVLGCVLVTEGWRPPDRVLDQLAAGQITIDEVTSPSEYPDRVEVRTTYCLFRDGTERAIERDRGAEPFELAGEASGQLIWALRRYLRSPSQAPIVISPRRLYAWTLARAARAVADVPDTRLHTRYRALLGFDEPASLAPFANRSPLGPPAASILGMLAYYPDWETAHRRLGDLLDRIAAVSPRAADLAEYVTWADPAMLQAYLAGLCDVDVTGAGPVTDEQIAGVLVPPGLSPTGDEVLAAARELVQVVLDVDDHSA